MRREHICTLLESGIQQLDAFYTGLAGLRGAGGGMVIRYNNGSAAQCSVKALQAASAACCAVNLFGKGSPIGSF